MKLHLTPGAGLQLFSGYGPGYVAINNVRHETCVVVTPEKVVPWSVAGFEALGAADFGFIAELKPEIVIFGTGATQRFPPPGSGAIARRRGRGSHGQPRGVPHLQYPRIGRPQGRRGHPHRLKPRQAFLAFGLAARGTTLILSARARMQSAAGCGRARKKPWIWSQPLFHEECELGLGFHAFGDHLQAQAVRHRDDRRGRWWRRRRSSGDVARRTTGRS